jgi:hypothetical protein
MIYYMIYGLFYYYSGLGLFITVPGLECGLRFLYYYSELGFFITIPGLECGLRFQPTN